MTYIKVRNLSKSFGNNKIIDSIDFDIQKGSSWAIIGKSGTGKSVLIKSIIGLIKADSGTAIIDNIEFTSASYKEKNKVLTNCGFLFQGGALFDSLNIEDNITFNITNDLSNKEKSNLAKQKLNDVGLSENLIKAFPCELSGGMMKRVALARTICFNPSLIIFDEPTTGLDPIMSNIINDLITKFRKNFNATTITITHDMNSVNKIATNVMMIDKGKIIWSGTKDELNTTNNIYVKQFINGEIIEPLE